MKKIVFIFTGVILFLNLNVSYSQLLFNDLPGVGIAGAELIIYNQKFSALVGVPKVCT